MKRRKLQILVVGAGDVAQRLVRRTNDRVGAAHSIRWLGLARRHDALDAMRQGGILPVAGDLDRRASLRRAGALARSAAATLLLAPPANVGADDQRMRRWLAAAAPRPRRRRPRQRARAGRPATGQAAPRLRPRPPHASRPLRDVYVSTTGVYGDCGGAIIDEVRRAHPLSDRARRRVAAERRLRARRHRHASILRAPGIYAAERLPVARLQARTPSLIEADDVVSNHIHADDLAHAVWLALFRGHPRRVINVVDDSDVRMGDYFDLVADRLGLPRPPRAPRVEVAAMMSPLAYSFLRESRRIGNTRLKRELRMRLMHATPEQFLTTMSAAAALQRPLL